MRLFYFTVLLFLVLFQLTTNAQVVEKEKYVNKNLDTLHAVMVTATKIPTKANTSGKTITIISADDIKNIPANSIDEIIKWTTGVNVNTRQPFGVQADIGIRGSTFSQVLILIDGIRQNDPLTSHFNSNIPINKSNIDRIEIIKGAAAASYGADAVAGVIHIKTKTFVSNKNDPNKQEISGNMAAGRDGLLLASIGLIDKTDTYHQNLSLNIANADGEKIDNPAYGIKDTFQGSPFYRNSFKIVTLSSSRAYYINEKYKIFFRVGYDVRDVGAKYFYTNSLLDDSKEKMDLVHAQLAITRHTTNSNLVFNFGHRTMHDKFTFNPNFPANTHRTLLSVATLDYTLPFTSNFTLLLGNQSFFKDIISSDRGNHNDYSTSIYVNLKYTPLEKLYVNFGQRFNYDTNYGTAWIPQVNIAYVQSKRLTFRMGGGKAIRAADYTERYVSYKIPNLSEGRNIGNPDLFAEETYSYDLGFDYSIINTDVSISWFQRYGSQIIDFVLENERNINNVSNLQDGKNYLYAKNIENVKTQGIEISITEVLYENSKTLFKSKVGYTYLDTNYNDDIKSKNLYHPRHIFNFMIQEKYEYFSLQFFYNYYVRDENESLAIAGKIPERYGILDGRINCTITPQLSFYIQLNNLSDVQYQEVLGAKMPSRWIAYGVYWKI